MGYSGFKGVPIGGTSTQIAQYNAVLKNTKDNYSVEALKREGKQQLELAKITGQQDNPYYDRFKYLAKTGDYAGGAAMYKSYLDDQTVQEGIRQANVAARIQGATNPAGVARSGGGGGGGGGGGMGSFIGGTTGFAQYQNYLNNQGQPTGTAPSQLNIGQLGAGARGYLNRGGANRRGAVQSAYQKILAANSSATSAPADVATAASVDENGNVYGMGVVPGAGWNPTTTQNASATAFKNPTLSERENKVLRKAGYTPESLYQTAMMSNNSGTDNRFGQPTGFFQPPIINSPFAGQTPMMDGRFAGQPMSSPYRQMPQMGAMGSRPIRIA